MTQKNTHSTSDSKNYDNTAWPRDFDIRIEVAEQQEVVQGSHEQKQVAGNKIWHLSEYDF